ncbi:MAG: LAGLIDADG family homing endonuclease [Patescibacteria group bacterium]
MDKKYFEMKRHAASMGARRRYELYGNPGTVEGRKLGGEHSLETHRKLDQGRFKVLKLIRKPRRSRYLAELLGIFIGDGHLSEYQASVVTGLKTDRNHALHIADMISKIFKIKVSIKERPAFGAIIIVASSKSIVRILTSYGMPIGNKLGGDLRIPKWITDSTLYMKMFIRGLFDTDGCVFMDRHIINGKLYQHLGWTITSAADTLLSDITDVLVRLGYRPTCSDKQNSVYLRRQSDVRRYFTEIGSSNSKHLGRFKKFCGRVPKRS